MRHPQAQQRIRTSWVPSLHSSLNRKGEMVTKTHPHLYSDKGMLAFSEERLAFSNAGILRRWLGDTTLMNLDRRNEALALTRFWSLRSPIGEELTDEPTEPTLFSSGLCSTGLSSLDWRLHLSRSIQSVVEQHGRQASKRCDSERLKSFR